MLAIGLAQQTLDPAAHYGIADFLADHYAKPRLGFSGKAQPVGNQTTFDRPLAALTHSQEITPLLDAGATPQTAPGWLGGRHCRIKPESGVYDRRDGDWPT